MLPQLGSRSVCKAIRNLYIPAHGQVISLDFAKLSVFTFIVHLASWFLILQEGSAWGVADVADQFAEALRPGATASARRRNYPC